jgi:glycosyltransferase involved in cell wall biosynthesis
MRIAHLSVADVFSARWTTSQALDGHDVHLISQAAPQEYQGRSVTCHQLPFSPPFGYYLNVWHLNRLIDRIQPDLLHVHYATGFGTLGRFCGFRPCVLSAWGSDILITPKKSKAMRARVIKNQINYDRICVTSEALAAGVQNLVPDLASTVTPFGVDTRCFAPRQRSLTQRITVGTVKTMHPIYGIDLLIRTFAAVRERLMLLQDPSAPCLQLLIVGGGPCLEEYRDLAKRLGVAEVTSFRGRLPNSTVPDVLAEMDIFVALSRSESFGVAVLEASACGIPVLVSDVGGLPEVVRNGETGVIVPAENVARAAAALETLVCNSDLRRRFGSAGRAFVQDRFEWAEVRKRVYPVYAQALSSSRDKNRERCGSS